MKIILLLLLTAYLFSCQQNQPEKQPKKTTTSFNDLSIPKIPKVHRIDTVMTNYYLQEIKFYDVKDRLIKSSETNLGESNFHKIYTLTKIYDTNNVHIYSLKIQDRKGTEMKFDQFGKMISKKSYIFELPALPKKASKK